MKKLLLTAFSFVFALPLYLSIIPLVNQTHAAPTEVCQNLIGTKYPCRCMNGKVVCYELTYADTVCKAVILKEGQKVGKYTQCTGAKKCADQPDPSGGRHNPECKTPTDQQQNFECQNDGSIKPNENKKGPKGGPYNEACSNNQMCSKGKCVDLKCTCRQEPGKGGSIVCIAPNDTRDPAKINKGAKNVKETSCTQGNVCTGGAGKATCKNETALEKGDCKCKESGKSNKIICKKDGKETEEECDVPRQVCKDTPNTQEKYTCEFTETDWREAEKTKPLPPPPPPPCAQGAFKDGKCTAFRTALGDVGTDAKSFIKGVFGVLLSISGGIALLLIIKSGYQMMASQGKPETLQQAREQMIAAIVGLIFLIFSLVILQTIGVDLLRIPKQVTPGKVTPGQTDKFKPPAKAPAKPANQGAPAQPGQAAPGQPGQAASNTGGGDSADKILNAIKGSLKPEDVTTVDKALKDPATLKAVKEAIKNQTSAEKALKTIRPTLKDPAAQKIVDNTLKDPTLLKKIDDAIKKANPAQPGQAAQPGQPAQPASP